MQEILHEEPNTSMMYHKLFPNRKLKQALEGKGYTFEMGSGMKLHRKFFASKHRATSGPKRQRTIQTLIILKDGKFYRKIPKASWVQLVDPSDSESITFGEVFMKKLLKSELQHQEERKQRLMKLRDQRLKQNG